MKASLALFLLATGLPAFAQQHSYAGQAGRDIKALSPDEVAQFLSGAGMGYARPAELNRFPGPMHVLELSDKLGLTPGQLADTKALMESHKTEARAIGAKRVEIERAIEMLFRSGGVDEAKLAQSVREAALLEGAYRLAHLETHRRMRVLLSEDQVESYFRLRGYDQDGEHPRHY